jgi:hypothetical protein
VTTVPQADVGSGDIVPEIGITGTPVIGPLTDTLYVVAKTKEVSGPVTAYVQRLHALDTATGAEKFGGPVRIEAQVPGNGQDSTDDGFVHFNGRRELNRSGLALSGGVVYLSFTSHGDTTPSHGWLLGYDAYTLRQVAAFNTTPDGGRGGIGMSAGAPAADAQGNLYLSAGIGTADPVGTADRVNYGQSILRLSPDNGLSVNDFFTPFNFQNLNSANLDLGSGGVLLLPDQPGRHPHLLLQAGQEGRVYLLDRDNLGGISPDQPTEQARVLEETPRQTVVGGSFDTPAFFNNLVYFQGLYEPLKGFELAFDFTSGSEMFVPTPVTLAPTSFDFTGGSTPSISADGQFDGIAWVLQNNLNGTNGAPNGPGVLHAYDAVNLQRELYNSAQTGQRDQRGNAVKFSTPTVANGHVYVGSQFQLDVYGVFPDSGVPPDAVPSGLTATPASTTSITLNWVNNASNATGVKVLRSTDGVNFMQIDTVARDTTLYTDTSLTPSTRYFYRLVASNQHGDSAASATASAVTRAATPALAVMDVGPGRVNLSWTATARDHYTVERSADGTDFVQVGGTIPPTQTTFVDTGLAEGTYFYRVTAFNADPPDAAVSNTIRVTVSPVIHIDHSAGFASHDDLMADGTTTFAGTAARLTDGQNGQAGSLFTRQRVGIRGFATTFTFQVSDGTATRADGFTFAIQGNFPTALGPSGAALGYQAIANSVAIKFDFFKPRGNHSSTGLYVDGHTPSNPPDTLPGDVYVELNGTGIDFNSGHQFQVDLAYDGSTLTETITDLTDLTVQPFTTQYAVDIRAHVGGDTAFVGFTGGAGSVGFNSVQDIQTWTYEEQEEGLPLRAPGDLRVIDATSSTATLTWQTNNAYTATGYVVERSVNGGPFTVLTDDPLPPDQTSFTDTGLAPATYAYRVRAVSAAGGSPFSNVDRVVVGSDTPIDHPAGFVSHDDLTANGSAFLGLRGVLTTGMGFDEVGSIFSNNRVDVTHFRTSFTFQIHYGIVLPLAEGMAFVIQGNGPTALGLPRGGLGYGAERPDPGRGIRRSIAVKFDVWDDAGEGSNSTGLFTDGRSPTVPEAGSGDVLVRLEGSPIDLRSIHPFRVEMAYDGTTLAVTITDVATGRSAAQSYRVDIPSQVGGNLGYAGFTGSTGLLTSLQEIRDWVYTTPPA